MVLEQYAPWKSHLFSLEKEYNYENNPLKYVLFQDFNKNWIIHCVPISEHSFKNR